LNLVYGYLSKAGSSKNATKALDTIGITIHDNWAQIKCMVIKI